MGWVVLLHVGETQRQVELGKRKKIYKTKHESGKTDITKYRKKYKYHNTNTEIQNLTGQSASEWQVEV